MPLFDRPAPLTDLDRFADEFETLRAAEGERLRRYALYREECEATRDTDLVTAQPGWSEDYHRVHVRDGERTRHRFTFPLAQALTVKHAHRIAGRLPDAVVDRREETPEERFRSDTMEKMWWSVVRASHGTTEFGDAAWDSSQVGSAAFEIYYDVKGQTPRFRAIDPGNCIVVPGLHDPHDFERAYRWWTVPLHSLIAKHDGQMFRDAPISLHDFLEDRVTVVTVSDRTKAITFVAEGERVVGLEEKTHDYGFVPYVVIPNLGPYRRVWGWADYEFVREVGKYISVALGREADVLRMVANGAVQAKGTKMTNHQILRALQEGGVVQTGREGDVAPISAPEMPNFEEGHIQRMFDLFERVGFAPPAAWGAIGASSGSDRGLQLQPMIELTSMKQKNWEAGLSRLGGMAFQMIEEKQTGKASFFGNARRGNRSYSFNFQMDATAVGQTVNTPVVGPDGEQDIVEAPATPKELFGGSHEIRFSWQNRVDVDDPAFVASELNKFAQGAQSLRTTLERLGVEAPEDEIKLIEAEAEAHPWLRQGMIKLMEMQLAAQEGAGPGQGAGGGAPFDSTAALGDALGTMTGKDGAALDTDALTGSLDGGIGQLFGGA